MNAYVIPIFVLSFLSMFSGTASRILGSHLHPRSGIDCLLSDEMFNSSTACWCGLCSLELKGVEDIRICRVIRLEAPLSGYLVDATGSLQIDGISYSIFRVGIRDGQEESSMAGEEFVFLAGGSDGSGQTFIYPHGTCVEDPDGGFAWEHEFLLDENSFLDLPLDFP